jgi:hypothetical protein
VPDPTAPRPDHHRPRPPRRNPLLDLTRQPRGTVPITCTAHGTFVSWCNPPVPAALVRCPAACSGAPSPAEATTDQRTGGS